MTEASGQWTAGVLIGLPIAAFFALVLLTGIGVALWYALRNKNKGKRWGYDIGGWERWSDRRRGFLAAGALTFVLAILTTAVGSGSYPWKAEYHQYRTVSGTVATVGNQGGINPDYAITFTSGAQQYATDDDRAALVKPGDLLTLRCIREYDYGSNNAGYYCKWGQP